MTSHVAWKPAPNLISGANAREPEVGLGQARSRDERHSESRRPRAHDRADGEGPHPHTEGSAATDDAYERMTKTASTADATGNRSSVEHDPAGVFGATRPVARRPWQRARRPSSRSAPR